MSQARILAFAGSTRKASLNKQLIAAAAKAAERAGAKVTLIDLADFPMPIFDQDYEAEHGMPENAQKLKQLFIEHNALLVASPEYNSSVSAVLKNAIDWVSRRAKGEPMKAAFLGKTAAIMAASPGGLGGIRGLVHLRSILQNIGVLVMPDQITLSEAHTVFDDDGTLNNERKQASIDALTEELVETVRKLQG
ncbi:MAG: NAD(P)H-dependent oxidoreductase [Planctomycetota bacterium]|nr:NAD(P)H-dependent oxidoreductase [Planctomycetota bacterium]MDA1164006.1 NAD(P)H-dependent oxidoreductase [Planctomycetota bacterium]